MNLIRRFFTWGFAKYVFIPSLRVAMEEMEGEEGEFEIVFEPDEELQATLNVPLEKRLLH
jgi:hypothetical protein